jgi:hypothetical protein
LTTRGELGDPAPFGTGLALVSTVLAVRRLIPLALVALAGLAFGLGTLVAVLGSSSQDQAPGLDTALVAYHDPTGVTLQHPPGWTVSTNRRTSVLLFIDPPRGVPFRRNINVMLQASNGPLSLDQYTALSLRELRTVLNAQIFQAGPTTLGGRSAYRVEWEARLQGRPAEFLSEWTVRRGDAWVLTYTSDPPRFAAELATVEQVVSSVRLP